MIIKFNEFLNESFDNRKNTLIVIQSPEEYHKITNDFIKWGYEYFMEGDWDEEELEDDGNYPFIITTYKFDGFYIDLMDNDNIEDSEFEYNFYHSIDDFYSDVNCVIFLKKKGVIKPDYRPRRKLIENLNESFDIKKEVVIHMNYQLH